MPRMIGIPGLFQFGFSDNTGRGGKGVDLPVLPTQEVFDEFMGGGGQRQESKVEPFKGRRKAD